MRGQSGVAQGKPKYGISHMTWGCLVQKQKKLASYQNADRNIDSSIIQT
jgi:hypothetical protein